MEGIFDRVNYDEEHRLSLATFQLRENAQRWWRDTSRAMREIGVWTSWGSFSASFRQEYIPESYFNANECEFTNLVHGNLKLAKYSRKFSSLLSYAPHIAGHERAKRNKFLEGLRSDLYPLVLGSSSMTYADVVNRAVEIEKGLLNRQSQVQQQATQGFHPMPQGTYSSQPPQMS
ncbi:hypothetical protein F511_26901 [Dorcoceras hygrometricum]|uniref:Retrotransposon gag domain-containing protein n=1 Tax=Dorcoceras hygrometricum TaxID=472368 RepID=A0A2Z7B955_9LAMI|nr:hypothetical protein F511_26901 [Dorcoceras hygrometricum]